MFSQQFDKTPPSRNQSQNSILQNMLSSRLKSISTSKNNDTFKQSVSKEDHDLLTKKRQETSLLIKNIMAQTLQFNEKVKLKTKHQPKPKKKIISRIPKRMKIINSVEQSQITENQSQNNIEKKTNKKFHKKIPDMKTNFLSSLNLKDNRKYPDSNIVPSKILEKETPMLIGGSSVSILNEIAKDDNILNFNAHNKKSIELVTLVNEESSDNYIDPKKSNIEANTLILDKDLNLSLESCIEDDIVCDDVLNIVPVPLRKFRPGINDYIDPLSLKSLDTENVSESIAEIPKEKSPELLKPKRTRKRRKKGMYSTGLQGVSISKLEKIDQLYKQLCEDKIDKSNKCILPDKPGKLLMKPAKIRKVSKDIMDTEYLSTLCVNDKPTVSDIFGDLEENTSTNSKENSENSTMEDPLATQLDESSLGICDQDFEETSLHTHEVNISNGSCFMDKDISNNTEIMTEFNRSSNISDNSNSTLFLNSESNNEGNHNIPSKVSECDKENQSCSQNKENNNADSINNLTDESGKDTNRQISENILIEEYELPLIKQEPVDFPLEMDPDLLQFQQNLDILSNISMQNCTIPIPPEKVELKCNYCPHVDTDFSSFAEHLQDHQKDGLILCLFCQKSFKDKTSMKRHMRAHTGERPYKCEVCGKCFSLPGNFKKHRDIHENKRTLPCEICGKLFRRNEHLKLHMRRHTGEKPYKCTLCDSAFVASYTLRIHMNVHLGRKPYKCHYCIKSFCDKSTMRKHIRVHTKERPFQCKICNRFFGESGTLKAHAASHQDDRPFPCPNCHLSFKTQGALKQHSKVHGGKKRFSCQFCSKTFLLKYNMVVHERKHTGDRPFPCSKCDKAFKSGSCLGKHMLTHAGEEKKKYNCSHCNKKFLRKAHLERHIDMHLGIKEFQCEICKKRFTSQTSVRNHTKIFHCANARYFPCDKCGKVFKRQIYVTKHICLPNDEMEDDELNGNLDIKEEYNSDIEEESIQETLLDDSLVKTEESDLE